MGRPPKNKEIGEENNNEEDQIERLLKQKEFSGLHYGCRSGTEIETQDLITTSSYLFDYVLGGGYRSGSWARFYGDPETGKSSMGLCWARNWQEFWNEDGFALIFNAEGRITKDLIDRTGIHTEGNRFRIIDCNNADVIFTLIERLLNDNPKELKYFVMIDSTDACQRSIDITKNLGESEKIGGSAAIQSAAGKRLSLLFNRRKHFLYMSSQVRDKLNTQSPGVQGKDASGGNAPKFYNSLVGQIQKPWTDTLIYENPSDKKSKIIGRLVSIKLIKTPNEKTGEIVQFPCKHGLKGGIWKNYEAMMICQAWEFYKKENQTWWYVTEQFAEELKSKNIQFQDKFQGERQMRDYFDSNNDLTNYSFEKLKNIIS